jgi:hypothetical protein
MPGERRERSEQQPQGESRRRDGQAVEEDGPFRKAGGVEELEGFSEAVVHHRARVGVPVASIRARSSRMFRTISRFSNSMTTACALSRSG